MIISESECVCHLKGREDSALARHYFYQNASSACYLHELYQLLNILKLSARAFVYFRGKSLPEHTIHIVCTIIIRMVIFLSFLHKITYSRQNTLVAIWWVFTAYNIYFLRSKIFLLRIPDLHLYILASCSYCCISWPQARPNRWAPTDWRCWRICYVGRYVYLFGMSLTFVNATSIGENMNAFSTMKLI